MDLTWTEAPWSLKEHLTTKELRAVDQLRVAILSDRRTYERVRLQLAARFDAEHLERLRAWTWALLTGWAKE
jgi:hypothetical protein